jgi:hypothetical protein
MRVHHRANATDQHKAIGGFSKGKPEFTLWIFILKKSCNSKTRYGYNIPTEAIRRPSI